MNVPPVAATRTEWRPRGPQAGFSLPICFNDSDVELSSQAAPISDKVQMIIESLRSSQSSLEMGDEMEGKAQSRQDGHPKVCKVVGSYTEVKAKGKSPSETHLADVSSTVPRRSSDSDSDDSVDRGIEEAILEYLKEKDDHKRKAEPCGTFLQTKIPRKCPPVPEISKQIAEGSTRVISRSPFPRSVKAETATALPVLPTKKHLKNNYLNDKMQKKLDSNKTSTKSLVLPNQTKCPPKAFSIFKKINCPAAVKMEDDSNDSSSDDGIEEAIQRYQKEKNNQESKRKKFSTEHLKEESDSTSDDGIEEAIRHYQLEQLKEKSEGVLKPSPHKQKPSSKSLIHSIEGASGEHARRNRLRSKKSRAESERQSAPAAPSYGFTARGSLSDRSNSNGSTMGLSKEEGFKERLALTSANTTAELMCAEAILDISKTVMPEAFSVDLAVASMQPLLPDNPVEDDASSIDSEDGIEQEIRRFLEQKAQLHRQPPGFVATREPASDNEPAEVKEKPTAIQKKPRLSLTQRRIHKEERRGKFNISVTDVTAAAPKLSPEQRKEPNSSQLCQKRETRAIIGARHAEPSGDKSSSLDSDEDLDTAIKDLLKTKKKSKKRVRDSKWKSRQDLKDEDPNFRCTSQIKKLKFDAVSKRSAFKKGKKLREEVGLNHASAKMSMLHNKQTSKNAGCDSRLEKLKVAERSEVVLHRSNVASPLKDDSSSVDSDDSIEQEIRRFLAEKAKVSTVEKGNDEDVCVPITDEGIKRENQLAEIPTLSFSLCSEPSLLNRHPATLPESLQLGISADGAQSGLTSAQSSSPGFLEPADGAGATRPMDITRTEKGRASLSPKSALSFSQSTKWRQCLGLPTTDSKTFNRTSFYITSSKINATTPATPPIPSRIVAPKLQTPNAVWSTVKTSRASLCSRETSVYTTFQTPLLSRFPVARQQPSLTQRLTPGHHSQCPVEGEAASMVHIPKDKTVFVELETNRTNHVQVRNRGRSGNRTGVALPCEVKREEESLAIDEKEVHLERAEEFIDEPDCESDQRNPENQQGFPPL